MNISRRAAVLAPSMLTAGIAAPSKLQTRGAKDVEASPISIGFETLDRMMFEPGRTYPRLAQLGVRWARCQTGWARTEREKGKFDFGWLDEVVDSLLGIGIQPWFNLGYGNRLYSPEATHESAVGWAPIQTPEQRDAWVRYVGVLAERYGKRVKHWEIWNEPNHHNFWQIGEPRAEDYIDLVKLTVPVIRKRIPGVTIIGGSNAGMGNLDYIERCFELGLGDYSEKYSYHPYRPNPEGGYRADLTALRGIINRHAPGMAVWQGENGAPSADGSAGALRQYPWNEEKQAKWLLRRLMTDLAMDVELTSYFHTIDLGNYYIWGSGNTNTTNLKGVLHGKDYTPKRSYYALQNLATLFDAQTKRTDLLLKVDDRAWTASFVRHKRPLYVYWLPADLHGEFSERKVSPKTWCGNAAELRSPVLVDLVSGDVTDITRTETKGGFWDFKDLPLRDYPLVITDKETLL